MQKTISDYLLSLGFIPNKCGYRYVFDLIYLATSGKETVDTVEKDVQNAISAAWLKGDVDALYNEFGETIDMKKGKPGNKQFIMTAAASILSKNKN